MNRSATKATAAETRRGNAAWMLLCILVIAVVARAPRLLESLWYDEIAAYIFYSSKGPWYIISNYHDPSNHILHSLLAWASIELIGWLGSTELAFRLPALVFSLISIVAMRELVRSVAGGRAGWVAVVLMAVLPVSVLEGADARGYSMMIFFSTAATALLVRLLREGEPRIAAMYAACCALGVWSHLMTVFVPVGHGVLAVILFMRPTTRATAKRAMLALAGAAAATLVLYAPALEDLIRFYTQQRAFVARTDQQPTLLGPEGFHALLQLGGSWSWWSATPGLVLVATGWAFATGDQRARLAMAAALFGVPLMILAVWSANSWMYARFMLFTLPGAVLLMALAIDRLWSRSRGLGMASLAIMVAASAADLLTRPPRQPLRDAVEFVLDAGGGSSPIIALGLNVPDITIYQPARFEILFTTHTGDEFERLINLPQVRSIIISYPHLVSQARCDRIRAAGFERAISLPGWADWGRGEVQVWRR